MNDAKTEYKILEQYPGIESSLFEKIAQNPSALEVLVKFNTQSNRQYTEGPINLDRDRLGINSRYVREYLAPLIDSLDRKYPNQKEVKEKYFKALGHTIDSAFALPEFYLLFDITKDLYRINEIDNIIAYAKPKPDSIPGQEPNRNVVPMIWGLVDGVIDSSYNQKDVAGRKKDLQELTKKIISRRAEVFYQVRNSDNLDKSKN